MPLLEWLWEKKAMRGKAQRCVNLFSLPKHILKKPQHLPSGIGSLRCHCVGQSWPRVTQINQTFYREREKERDALKEIKGWNSWPGEGAFTTRSINALTDRLYVSSLCFCHPLSLLPPFVSLCVCVCPRHQYNHDTNWSLFVGVFPRIGLKKFPGSY